MRPVPVCSRDGDVNTCKMLSPSCSELPASNGSMCDQPTVVCVQVHQQKNDARAHRLCMLQDIKAGIAAYHEETKAEASRRREEAARQRITLLQSSDMGVGLLCLAVANSCIPEVYA